MVKMGTVWDRTAEFVTDNLSAIVPVALLAFFVPFSIQGNLATLRQNAGADLAVTLELVSLAFGVLVLWGSLAIVAMALGLRDARAVATRRLPAALLVWIALFAALVAPVLVLLLVTDTIALAMEIAQNGLDFAALGRAMAIVYVLLIVAPLLLWLGARLIVVGPGIVAEQRLFSAIRRSFQLTRGHGLMIVGVILLYGLVAFVAKLAAQTVFGSIFQLISGPASGVSLSQVLASVMVALVQTAFAVIAPAFTAKLFLALTQREAAGIP
ncbi:glycerophosphoryl diester phosphodiesterase membrane domain-containing protein [Sphingomonas sp.]|uniref:glycerophosphoryl diester phosphodiesterase membrane domain-containing protein n=1 Tax=Sphingomonas sp. TaxID=28214 RepID=UPI001B168D7B|nr:glycerophosphoryl diester phosphodiesterase membrane domain-containing protein [Sphingomonas sp.]MBO9713644.1 glycerophosphoryl diester phosphodiesterase membrane domain-containing protein [Sphingomonas sp.]